MSTSEPAISFASFVRLVLDALEAANVEYLIGGAVALAAWGDPRTTRDLDLVVDLPFESMALLSQEVTTQAPPPRPEGTRPQIRGGAITVPSLTWGGLGWGEQLPQELEKRDMLSLCATLPASF